MTSRDAATPNRDNAPYGDATIRYQELAEHALRHHADIDDEIGTALMVIDVRNAIAQAVAEAARSEPAPKLCADCGCELECVKHGCAKKYAEHRNSVLEEARSWASAMYEDSHKDKYDIMFEQGWEAASEAIEEKIRTLKGNAAPQVEPVSKPEHGTLDAQAGSGPAESASRCVAVPKDDLPLRCKSVDGALDMRVGVKVLAFAAERCPDLWNGEDDLPGCRITDPIKFAKEVERELNRESEDGSTRLSRMLDEAIAEAINQGAEGVEEILLSER